MFPSLSVSRYDIPGERTQKKGTYTTLPHDEFLTLEVALAKFEDEQLATLLRIREMSRSHFVPETDYLDVFHSFPPSNLRKCEDSTLNYVTSLCF